MILNIELEDREFLDIDLDDIVYIVGHNQRKLWQLYRSLYYYFNKSPSLSTSVYGDDDINFEFDGDNVPVRGSESYFVSSRDSIYDQMRYKKGNMLFDTINSFGNDFDVTQSIENITDEVLKLEILLQSKLDKHSSHLKVNFNDLSYLDILKSYLSIGYTDHRKDYPLEFMDTENLLDDFLNFLQSKLKSNGNTTWLVLYNIDSVISGDTQQSLFVKLKELMDDFDLKIICLSHNLENIPIDRTDVEKIVLCTKNFHQLLPIDELGKSIESRYPNELNIEHGEILESIVRTVSYVGDEKSVSLAGKDLVILKVLNDILNYETSYCFENHLLSDAEAKFLQD